MDKKSFIQVLIYIGHFDISMWNWKYTYIILKKKAPADVKSIE